MTAALDLVGQMAPLRVRLDRNIDRQKPCHQNIAVVRPGKPPHAAALHCETCNSFRGWMRAEALTFIENLAQRFGATAEPLTLREQTIGDHVMADDRKYDNSGILFKNDDKQGEKSPDYKGNMTVGGAEFWLSAWIKEGKRGKFLSLSLKAKDAPKTATTKSAGGGAPFNDDLDMPF